MMEVFAVLKTAGATSANLGSAAAFGRALHSYASQNEVRNQIWEACLSSLKP